jgi:hypothetical protein
MPRNAMDTQNYPRVLNGVVGIIEHCSDCADLRLNGMTHHFLEPFWIDNLNIIV